MDRLACRHRQVAREHFDRPADAPVVEVVSNSRPNAADSVGLYEIPSHHSFITVTISLRRPAQCCFRHPLPPFRHFLHFRKSASKPNHHLLALEVPSLIRYHESIEMRRALLLLLVANAGAFKVSTISPAPVQHSALLESKCSHLLHRLES